MSIGNLNYRKSNNLLRKFSFRNVLILFLRIFHRYCNIGTGTPIVLYNSYNVWMETKKSRGTFFLLHNFAFFSLMSFSLKCDLKYAAQFFFLFLKWIPFFFINFRARRMKSEIWHQMIDFFLRFYYSILDLNVLKKEEKKTIFGYSNVFFTSLNFPIIFFKNN